MFHRIMVLILLSHFMTVYAAPDESPEKAAEKLMRAWWQGDFDAIRADCNPQHDFLKPGTDLKPLVDNLNYSRKWLGELVKLEVKQVQTGRNGFKSVRFLMFFQNGVYEGGIHLTSENRFTGVWGPFLEKSGEMPVLDKERMLEDFDHMVTVLRDTMPHDLAIRDEFGIDVRQIFARYRTRIIGRESLPEFARLVQRALAACKGHHLWTIKPTWSPTSEWYRNYCAHSIPPETLPVSRNVKTLLDCLPAERGPATFQFLYWDGNYYTAPEFSIDGKRYRGPLKLIAVDGKKTEELEPLLRDTLPEFDRKNKRFFRSDFYTSLPSAIPGCRTFLFETSEKKTLSITVPDDAELSTGENDMFSVLKQGDLSLTLLEIPKQVLYWREHSLVYLRVPVMNPKDLPFYEEQLRPILEKEKPRYAVIDICGNGGGSDGVPTALLRKLSANPITWKGFLATPANERVRRHLKLGGRDFYDHKSVKNIPFLDNRKFDVQEFSAELRSEKNACVEHIYVIAHGIYSAAGTLVAIAKGSEHVTAVGFSGTKILGMGIDPYCFLLPNSKLIISVEPAIDLSDCGSAAETLHLGTEVELQMSPGEYLAYRCRSIPADCRDYLEKEDPFMQKIFAMIREREAAGNRKVSPGIGP